MEQTSNCSTPRVADIDELAFKLYSAVGGPEGVSEWTGWARAAAVDGLAGPPITLGKYGESRAAPDRLVPGRAHPVERNLPELVGRRGADSLRVRRA
jgi:hypothetical protein